MKFELSLRRPVTGISQNTSYEIKANDGDNLKDYYFTCVNGHIWGHVILDSLDEYEYMVALMVTSQFFDDYEDIAKTYQKEIWTCLKTTNSSMPHIVIFYRDIMYNFFKDQGLTPITYGNIVKEASEKLGLSYNQLGEKIGVKGSTLNKVASTGEISEQIRTAINLYLKTVEQSEELETLNKLKKILKDIIETT